MSRRSSNGGGYTLIAGYRRVAAAHQADLETVPALNADDDLHDDERVPGTLIENPLRLDLDPVDEAHCYQHLVDAGWTKTG